MPVHYYGKTAFKQVIKQVLWVLWVLWVMEINNIEFAYIVISGDKQFTKLTSNVNKCIGPEV